MGSFVIMPLFLCTMTLHFDSLCSSTLEAEPGESVTISNYLEDILTTTSYIFWFKHTNDSVPLLLGCKRVITWGKAETCSFYTETERIVMSVHGRNTSLTISTVNLSDTGLYYCGFMQLVKMNFCKPVYLHVKGGNEALIQDLDKAKDCGSSAVFVVLTGVSGAVIVILLSILMITLKHIKTHRGANTGVQVHEDQESDSVNYAALQISSKKTKRTGKRNKSEDHHVLYASVRR